ncbi:MAG: MlaD family protein, partial [Solirubrobacteraceae bacterium]
MGTRSNRVVAVLAVAVVAALVYVLLLTGGDPYRVKVRLQDAGQLVGGNQVRVGGSNIGTVSGISLADNGEAEIELKITDDDYAPLHRGTRAVLRNSSLSSVAGRILVLEPGPNSAAEIPDGGTIAAVDTRAATDIDQVLNAVDVKGREYLQTLVRGGATAFAGAEAANNRLLERLSPALSQLRQTVEELASDEPALQRLITSSAAVASTLASSRDDLENGLVATAATLRATADERAALRRTIERGPALLRRANTTFANTRPLLQEARPLLRETRPLAPKLATTLRLVRPLVSETKPLLRDVRRTLPALDDVLRRTPRLADQTQPGFTELARALTGAAPIVADARAYAPDLVAGLSTSFGGKAAGHYDANGHYGRIAIVFDSNSAPDLLKPLLGDIFD